MVSRCVYVRKMIRRKDIPRKCVASLTLLVLVIGPNIRLAFYGR